MIPWKPLAFILLAGALSFVVVAFFLPDDWRVERTLSIAAPPEQIAPLVADLHRWRDWYPWGEKDDPTLRRTYSGAEQGTGARMRYEGEKFGTGDVEITHADASKVAYGILLRGGDLAVDGSFTLTPAGSGTRVTWSEGGKIPNPLARWFRSSFETANGGDYQRGLLNIQALAEGKPLPFPTATTPDAGTPPDAERDAGATGP